MMDKELTRYAIIFWDEKDEVYCRKKTESSGYRKRKRSAPKFFLLHQIVEPGSYRECRVRRTLDCYTTIYECTLMKSYLIKFWTFSLPFYLLWMKMNKFPCLVENAVSLKVGTCTIDDGSSPNRTLCQEMESTFLSKMDKPLIWTAISLVKSLGYCFFFIFSWRDMKAV